MKVNCSPRCPSEMLVLQSEITGTELVETARGFSFKLSMDLHSTVPIQCQSHPGKVDCVKNLNKITATLTSYTDSRFRRDNIVNLVQWVPSLVEHRKHLRNLFKVYISELHFRPTELEFVAWGQREEGHNGYFYVSTLDELKCLNIWSTIIVAGSVKVFSGKIYIEICGL